MTNKSSFKRSDLLVLFTVNLTKFSNLNCKISDKAVKIVILIAEYHKFNHIIALKSVIQFKKSKVPEFVIQHTIEDSIMT
jgi:HKD family nuclease